MGHAEREGGETREKKIINLERLIARENEREEKRKRLIAARKKTGEREREREMGVSLKMGLCAIPRYRKGGNKYAAAAPDSSAQKTCLGTAMPLIRPLKRLDPDRG